MAPIPALPTGDSPMQCGWLRLATVLTAAALLTGCGLNGSAELVGTWLGAPDTSAAQVKREKEKYLKLAAASGADAVAAEESADAPSRPPIVTDWEQYDVQVTLEFLDASRMRISVSGEAAGPSIEGAWKIVESTPAIVMIELATPGDTEESAPIRRRFELGLDRRDDRLVGFTFNEAGADRRLGTLYFSRPGED